MNQYQKHTGRALSIPGGLMYGGIVSLVITLIGATIVAKLLDGEILEESEIGYAAMVILMLASCAGTMTAQAKIKRQYLLVSGLSAGLYSAVLFSITALFFGGQYEAVGVTLLLILGGSVLALLLRMGPDRGGKHKKRVKWNC